jgi:hypothetical protein
VITARSEEDEVGGWGRRRGRRGAISWTGDLA